MIPPNFDSLHAEEESIRQKSLGFIGADPALSDNMVMIHDALELIDVLRQQQPRNDDYQTIQLLGIRMFNIVAGALKLGLSGYYQTSWHLSRDILETANLLDYFFSNPAEISSWKAADHKMRQEKFAPAVIRKALDARDGYTTQKRREIYQIFSEYAAHAAYRGFSMLIPRDGRSLVKSGPFFEKEALIAVIGDLAKYFSHAALTLSLHFKQDPSGSISDKARWHFLRSLEKWCAKYFKGTQ